MVVTEINAGGTVSLLSRIFKIERLSILALGFLVLLLPFVHLPWWFDSNQNLRLIVILCGTGVLSGLWLLAAMKNPRIELTVDHMDKALLFFWLLLAASLISAQAFTGGKVSDASLHSFLRWSPGIFLALGMPRWIRTEKDLRFLIVSACLAGTGIALIGLAQEFSLDKGFLGYFRENALSAPPQGSFGNRNLSASIVAALLPTSCFWFADLFRADQLKRSRLVLNIALAGISLLVMVLYLRYSVTRSSWLGASLGMVALVLGWLVHRRAALRSSRLVMTSIFMLIGLGLFVLRDGHPLVLNGSTAGDFKRHMNLSSLLASVFDLSGAHWQSRLAMWKASVAMVREHPLGIGLGSWGVAYPDYAGRLFGGSYSQNETPIDAHNDYFQILAELGVIGALTFLGLVVAAYFLAKRLIRDRSQSHSQVLAGIALTGLAGMISTLGDAVFSFPLQLPSGAFYFFFLLGLIRGAARIAATEAEPHGRAVLHPLGPVRRTILGVVAFTIFAGIGAYVYRLSVLTPALALAASANRLGEFQVCLEVLYGTRQRDVRSAGYYALLARCHGGRGESLAQERAIARALEYAPHRLELHALKAELLWKQGRLAELRTELATGFALQSDWMGGLCLFGELALLEGRSKEVITQLEPHLAKYSGVSCYASVLGTAYQSSGLAAAQARLWTTWVDSELPEAGWKSPESRALRWFDIATAWERAAEPDLARSAWVKGFGSSPTMFPQKRRECLQALVRMKYHASLEEAAHWLESRIPPPGPAQ